MALTPTLSYEERNDNKLLTLTDTTANWGTGGNIAVTDVTTLTVVIAITTSNDTTTTYDSIDLYALGSGPFATQAAMVFPIDASMIKDGGIAIGTSDDELPDGLWEITYTINATVGTPETIFIDGKVRVAVYELLRQIPVIYNCNECKSKTILDALYAYGCLNVLRSDAYVAKSEELISLLYVTERIVTNGSNYTW